MAKAKEIIRKYLSLVDVVLEVADARVPFSSRNSELKQLIKGKQNLLILTKADLADPVATERWIAHLQAEGQATAAVNLISGTGMTKVKTLIRDLAKQARQDGRRCFAQRPVRSMVVGIPNVGKSSLTNRLAGRKGAKVEDRPGVTRAEQWIRAGSEIELLDTPGMLKPRLKDRQVSFKLAAVGAIRPPDMDAEDLALELLSLLLGICPDRVRTRYGLDSLGDDSLSVMEAIGRRRGFLIKGDKIDLGKTAALLLHEFQQGKLGRVTLDAWGEAPEG